MNVFLPNARDMIGWITVRSSGGGRNRIWTNLKPAKKLALQIHGVRENWHLVQPKTEQKKNKMYEWINKTKCFATMWPIYVE